MSLEPLQGIPASEKRLRLLELLKQEAYLEGDFTLASGAKSDFYLDCRLVTLHPVGALLIGSFVIPYMKKLGVTVVGGPTLAADPIIGATVGLSSLFNYPVNGFIVRKASKEHGTGKLIEGNLPERKPVLMVEDVITSAGSVAQAIQAVRDRGNEVKAVWALVDRQAGGVKTLEEMGVEVQVLFRLDEIRTGGQAG